jgi:ribosome-associated protein
MLIVDSQITIPLEEFQIDFARSGGPGGQNVNKVNSKAQLRWNPSASPSLSEPVRERLLRAVSSRLTGEGDLLITSQRTRDQARNVEDCLEKLRLLVLSASRPPKPRRPSRPTRASKERRLEDKQRRSASKQLRKKPSGD